MMILPYEIKNKYEAAKNADSEHMSKMQEDRARIQEELAAAQALVLDLARQEQQVSQKREFDPNRAHGELALLSSPIVRCDAGLTLT